MDGPKHYIESERLLEIAHEHYEEGFADSANFVLVRAEVHATLALAAATALRDLPVGYIGPWAAALA